jgi:hypothetical protein
LSDGELTNIFSFLRENSRKGASLKSALISAAVSSTIFFRTVVPVTTTWVNMPVVFFKENSADFLGRASNGQLVLVGCYHDSIGIPVAAFYREIVKIDLRPKYP